MKHAFLATLAALALLTPLARANGPENWVLVVNGDNPDSVAIADTYAQLRKIPASNRITLTGIPTGNTLGVDDFRAKILQPILAAIRERGLTAQIDGVVYAPGFPYSVDVSADTKGKKLAFFQTNPASLTGLTYLYEQVLRRDTGYLELDANFYARKLQASGTGALPDLTAVYAHAQAVPPASAGGEEKKWLAEAAKLAQQLQATPAKSPELLYNLACTLALGKLPDDAMVALTAAAAAGWMNAGLTEADSDLTSLRARPDFKALLERMRQTAVKSEPPTPFHNVALWSRPGQTGRRYLLSALLGHVGEKTESRDEILARLQRSAGADGSKPAGTIYYMASTDWARTGPRKWIFPSAVAALQPLGVKGENLAGAIPPQGAQVAGAMMGVAGFDWKASGATLLPGAFCDHLTSFGGVLTGAGQTLLTEYLKNGAAGACGTVTEPYNVPGKFPTPFVHVYYASGATLAEAFFQSVTGPYQQLLIADPLCRPWARPTTPLMAGLKPGELVTAPRTLKVTASQATRLELYVDGRRLQTALSGKPLKLDPHGLAPGTHELRIVAVSGPLEATSRAIVPFTVR